MTAEDVLHRMLVRLDNGRGWAQGAYADPTGERRCLIEALMAEEIPRALRLEVADRLSRAIGCPYLAVWNDTQPSFATIQAAIRAAIENGK